MDVQLEKLYQIYSEEPDALRKNVFLQDLQNRNETLFFRLLIKHIKEMGTSKLNCIHVLSFLMMAFCCSSHCVHAHGRPRVPEVR